MGLSLIEWTDATWNPVRGCTKVSPGCKHCYAETFAERFRGVEGHPYQQGFDLRLVPGKLEEPLRWKTPRTIFVNSMSDLFHEGVPFEYIAACYGVMAQAPHHRFQVLTKRPGRRRLFFDWVRLHGIPADAVVTTCASNYVDIDQIQRTWPLPNVWEGVSVESRDYLSRIDELRATPASLRFLSLEPLLEQLTGIDLQGIDWVIVGGESGHGARPLETEWARHLCALSSGLNIPFFFKQWGGVRKKAAGRMLDGRTWDEMPVRP
jgi:protein gp37